MKFRDKVIGLLAIVGVVAVMEQSYRFLDADNGTESRLYMGGDTAIDYRHDDNLDDCRPYDALNFARYFIERGL